MSQKTKHTFKATALAVALLAVYGPALADSTSGSVSVGIGNWSNDRPLRGGFDGMRDSGAYGLLDGDILKRDDATGTWFGLKARSLGLDSRELRGEWQRQGNIGFSLEYSRIPRDQPFIYNTGLQGIGTTTQTRVTVAPGAGANWELGTTRDRVTAKFFKNLGTNLKFNASFRNETKDGTRPWSRGGQPEFAVDPIDSTIRIFEGILTYSQGPLQLSGGYYGTSYDTKNAMVITTGTASGATTPATLNLSLPLDNQSHEIFVNGGYSFTPTTRGTFKVSYSRATQDEFLPTATPGLVWCATCTPSPLSPTNLDGRLDTTLLEAGLTARPMPKLSVVANLRYRDFADKTPLRQIISTGGGVWNTPFSYTNKVGKVEGTYRLPQAFSLLGGVEYYTQDRFVPTLGTLFVPFRAKLDETTYRLQLRKSMSETVNGSVAYLHGNRNGSAYTVPGDPNEDLINPMNIADRKRDKWRAMLDWSPANRVSFQFVVEDSRDDYGGNVYGLQEGKARLYSVDGSFKVNSSWDIHAWYTRDENKAFEITQRDTPTTKYTDLSEDGDSFGAGVKGKVSDRVKVGGNIEQFRSINKYNQSRVGPTGFAAAQVPASPPDITNTLLRLKLYASYAIQKNADVGVNLIHERWSTDDWSWFMFPATGRTPWPMMTVTDGSTTLTSLKQNTTFLGIRYTYRFQ